MKLMRKEMITEQEAQVLLDAIRERGELVFPLDPGEVVAVKTTLQKAQAQAGPYQPNVWERLKAKWNFSYASVASFGLWLGAMNVEAQSALYDGGKPALKLALRSNNQIEWDALKATEFRAPFT